jgi:hypothetical protein
MTDTERLIRLEHDCNVLATVLGLCTGTLAVERADRGLTDLMQNAELALKQLGVQAGLVDAFAIGARVGMEPPPHERDSAPLSEGLRRNIDALLRKAA